MRSVKLSNQKTCHDCGKRIARSTDVRFRVPPTTALTPGFAMTPARYDSRMVDGRLRSVQTQRGDVQLVGGLAVCRPCYVKV